MVLIIYQPGLSGSMSVGWLEDRLHGDAAAVTVTTGAVAVTVASKYNRSQPQPRPQPQPQPQAVDVDVDPRSPKHGPQRIGSVVSTRWAGISSQYTPPGGISLFSSGERRKKKKPRRGKTKEIIIIKTRAGVAKWGEGKGGLPATHVSRGFPLCCVHSRSMYDRQVDGQAAGRMAHDLNCA